MFHVFIKLTTIRWQHGSCCMQVVSLTMKKGKIYCEKTIKILLCIW